MGRRSSGAFGIPTPTHVDDFGCGVSFTGQYLSGDKPMTKVVVEMPQYLCARLDRLASERDMTRDELIHDLLAGVVDRETERVAAELRRIAWRRDRSSSSPWVRAA